MQETFYATVAQLCFALLGLWWIVVQFKYQQWMTDPSHRRMAYDISLYFILPGIMSLVSLLAADAKFLWRAGFTLAGILGLVESFLMVTSAGGTTSRSIWLRLGRAVVLALYLLIILFAAIADLPQRLGLPLQPLEIEGLLNALIIFLGVNFAWMFFAEPMPGQASPQ